ncbi:MAG: BTAD domain-containing putative transcriptional regulator, partial [Pseudomonadota bacterium]|nr:BTAD domain-containing putative transcriptional regulator [Pseudomonadota bacterium]
MTADAPHPDVRLELRLLGEPAARVGAAELRTVNRKLICALAILALSRDGRASRDQVASRLWSESGQARARGSLRQMVTAMRKDFEEVGFDGYEATRSQLALRSGRVATDAEHLLDRAAAGEVHPALLDSVDLPASLMRGWDDVDPAFAEWLEAERDRLRERLRRALRQILDHAGIDAPAGRDAAKALLRLDPTQERVAFALMTSLARGGDGAGALAVFGDLRRMLEQAHDAAPGRELQTLADRIRAGDFGSGDAAGGEAGASVGAGAGAETRPAGPGRSGRPDPVLEVEPFRLHGGGEAERAALDGLRDALIAAMVRFRELKVAEVDAPRPDDGAPAEGGGGGGVRYALRASARPRPGGLSISMTLRERTSGEFLWSETEELDLDPSAAGADPAAAAARRDAPRRHRAHALTGNQARARAREGGASL